METWAFCRTCDAWYCCPVGVDGSVVVWSCQLCGAEPEDVEYRMLTA